MKADFLTQKIPASNLLTLFKSIIVGVIIGEICYFSEEMAHATLRFIEVSDIYLAALATSVALIAILIIYLVFFRKALSELLKITRSYRFDILLMLGIGLSISISSNGIFAQEYKRALSSLNFAQVLIAIFIPFFIITSLVARALASNLFNKKNSVPFFISDLEKQTRDEDLLGFSEDSLRFAERVYNGGSSDSLVFGIDAPWGIGKSTFINFCIEVWLDKYFDKVIVYKFNPLIYEDRSNLLEKLVDGLIRSIQKNEFTPEIRPIVSRYSRFIKTKSTLSKYGFNLELTPNTYTVDDAFEDVESVLGRLKKKVIVVVDDLDRLNFSAIKDVLFAIKKSLTLPNVTFVLCYDTENIALFEKNHKELEKITEFLEKFVNVKISLFLDTRTLSKYISEHLEKVIENNLQIDPYSLDKIRETVNVIPEIFNSKNYHHYKSVLSDIRKLKRLINTLVLLEVEKTDFENSDINKQDLIHLLLIYINYPHIFRKIYDTETDGKRGFFSLISRYDSDYVDTSRRNARQKGTEERYRNSKQYEDFVKNLPPTPKFLLDQLFDVSVRFDGAVAINAVSEEKKNSYACFNGESTLSGGRNLEAYLNLIVKQSRPRKREQYKFYLNAKQNISNNEPIEKVLSADEFSFKNSEETHQQFWRVIVNSAHELDHKTCQQLINYLLDHIPDYSLITNNDIGVGLRDDILYYLIKLLDTGGWSDISGHRQNNTDENVIRIADWILGGNQFHSKGIVEVLSSPERGIPGLYDLMVFRLICSADRNGGFYNVQRALSLHDDPKNPTSGLVTTIAISEMREISQRIYKIFEEKYIKPRLNLFELTNEIQFDILVGKFQPYIEDKISSKVISREEIDLLFSITKTRIASFIVYQLGNSLINHGVGCGYYDETGKQDQKGIALQINKYLFNTCFNPENGSKNYEHFLDYLLANFATTFPLGEGRYNRPTLGEYTTILDKKLLAEYWKNNRASIANKNYENYDKKINNGNYSASYKENLKEVYKVLDELLVQEP